MTAPEASGANRPRPDRWTRGWRWGLRLTGAVALGALVWRSTGLLSHTASALTETRWTMFALAMGVYALGLWISAVRLRGLARAAGRSIGVGTLFADVVKSTALNALITVGSGEVYRSVQLTRRGFPPGDAGAVVVLDRLIGLAVIGGAGAVGLVAFGGDLTGLPVPLPAALAAAALGAMLARMIGQVVLTRVAPATWPLFSQPRVLALAFGCSLGVLGTSVLNVWLLSRALGLTVGPEVLLFAAPLVAVAAMLPISIGGIGVREAGYALLLAPYGVTAGEAVALGLLQYATYLVTAAVGGLMLISERGPADARGSAAGLGRAG